MACFCLVRVTPFKNAHNKYLLNRKLPLFQCRIILICFSSLLNSFVVIVHKNLVSPQLLCGEGGNCPCTLMGRLTLTWIRASLAQEKQGWPACLTLKATYQNILTAKKKKKTKKTATRHRPRTLGSSKDRKLQVAAGRKWQLLPRALPWVVLAPACGFCLAAPVPPLSWLLAANWGSAWEPWLTHHIWYSFLKGSSTQ